MHRGRSVKLSRRREILPATDFALELQDTKRGITVADVMAIFPGAKVLSAAEVEMMAADVTDE